MDSPTPPPPTSNLEPDYIKKYVWHSSDIAHVEAKIIGLCKEDFGIPKRYFSAPLRDSNEIPISNSIFLPPPGARLEDYHWDITGQSHPPPLPDRRELWLHVTGPGVGWLTSARTPLELAIAVGHAMLGWLSMMHKGFLHRDIGMVGLLRVFDQTKVKAFVPGDFGGILEGPQAGADDQVLQDQVERLRKTIADLEIADTCCGVLQPSDMTVEMKDYYVSGGKAHQPDYYDTMSSGLLRSIRVSEPYLHSPVDDLESFYYTMQWAAVNNNGSASGKHKTENIEALRVNLRDTADRRFQTTLSIHRIRPDNKQDIEKFGPFLTKLQPVFKEWYPSILALVQSWKTVKDGVEGADDVSQYYIRHALVFAYRGVSDYMEIVHKYRAKLGD